MKKVFLLAIAVLPLSVFAQNTVQSFFDKYSGRTGFTTVKISPKMFDLVASIDVDDADLSAMKDITGLNVLVYEAEEGKSFEMADKLYTEAKSLVHAGYDELMSVIEEDTDLRILAKSASEGVVNDLLIVGKDAGEFIYVNIMGSMDLKKISSMGDSMDIKGMEHLKELDEPGKK